MNPDILIDKLDKLVGPELQDIVIVKNIDGSYELYDFYKIKKQQNKKYLVTTKTTFVSLYFYSLKNATAWCTFDKRNKIYEASRIYELDCKLEGVESSIKLHKYLMLKNNDTESKLIYFAKLSDENQKRTLILQELANYIKNSYNWQQKKFTKEYQYKS